MPRQSRPTMRKAGRTRKVRQKGWREGAVEQRYKTRQEKKRVEREGEKDREFQTTRMMMLQFMRLMFPVANDQWEPMSYFP